MSEFQFSENRIFWFISIDTYIDNFISRKVDPFFEIKCETIDKWFISFERLTQFTEFMNFSFYFVFDDLKYRMNNKKNNFYKIEISITSNRCISRHYIITCSLMYNIGRIIDKFQNIELSCINCKYPMMISPKNKIKIDDIYLCYFLIYKFGKKEIIVDFNSLFERIKIIIVKHKEKIKQLMKLKRFLNENNDIKELVREWLG
jgi:hypothetical protein